MNHLKLLLVEDDETYQRYVHTILAEDIDQIHHARTMAEAKAELAVNEFDVIVLDLGLPDSDRPETIAIIPDIRREHPRTAVLVASVDEEFRKAALAAGANLFLDKSTTAKHRAMITAVKVAMKEVNVNPKKQSQRLERMSTL